ncbi:MAG: CarD family transcriptional regulator [Pseudomonadota bacterium]
MSDAPFADGSHVVHGSHGIGVISGTQSVEAAGITIEMRVVSFEATGMTLRIPAPRMGESGLRPLATKGEIDETLSLLATRSKVRHADQYRLVAESEQRIATGDIKKTARVARDMFRSPGHRETPYSVERAFNAAVDRLADEIALVLDIDVNDAREKVVSQLTDERPDTP